MKNVLIIIFIFQAFTSFSQDKRLALVIGNSNYEKGELKNPVNDAKLISKTLDSLGFDVIEKYNLSTKRELLDAIRDFGVKRDSYNVGFVYYAGHGVQIKAENFLLPTKEKFTSEIDIEDFGVSVQSILRYLESKTDQVNILILDACRDNPFEVIWNKTRSLNGGGLAKIAPPTGSLIAFSTDAGKTAADGKNENSIYTESLAKNMLIESISIDQVFRNVRSEVLTKTSGAQRPVESTQLTGTSFYLVKSNYEEQFRRVEELIKNNEYLDALSIVNLVLQTVPNNVKALLLRASLYEGELNKTDKAIIDYDKAIEINPNDANIYYHKGELLFRLKLFDEALKEYSKAIKIDPGNIDYLISRGQLFEYKLKKSDKALEDYNKAIEIEPKNVEGLFNRAHLYHDNLKMYDKAFLDYQNILNINPKFQDALNNIAILLKSNLGDDKKALEFFNKSIELNPKEYLYYYNRGNLYENNLNDSDNALLDYSKAIELNQKDSLSYILRGQIFENKLNYEKALSDYNKAIELAPQLTDGLIRRGKTYEKLNQYDKALSDFKKVIEINPKDSSGLILVGNVYSHQKNSIKALEYYDKHIGLFPNDPLGFLNRGFVNYDLGKFDNVLLDFNKAIEIDSMNASYFSYRGQLYKEKLSKNDKALSDYNRSIELEPENALHYNNRAILFRKKLRNFDLAMQDYNKAIKLEPKNPSFYSNRAILELFDLKLTDIAQKDFIRAIELDSTGRDLYYHRIKSFLFLEDYENAIKDIQKTILMDKNDPEGYFDLSIIYKKQKKYVQSIIQLSKAIELLNGSDYEINDDTVTSKLGIEDLYLVRAELYKLLSDFESTCEDYRNAIETLKEDSEKKQEIELLISQNCK